MSKIKEILEKKGPHFNIVASTTPVLDALTIMQSENLSYVVVMDDNQFLGIMSERDYSHKIKLQGRHSDSTTVKEIMTKDDFRNILYKTISSTALDEGGIAKTNSLRQIEVCVPLTLFGMVHQFPSSEKYMQALKYCFSYIKRMGLQRNRGFGNCTLSLFKSDNIQ
jgi:hypothetical protein